MKKSVSIILIISMLLSCIAFTVPVSAKATAENIAYEEALYFETAPTIDGYISEAEWGESTFSVESWDCATTDDTSPWYEFFYNRISATNRDDYDLFKYTVWLRWDLNRFYVGIKVVDPDVHSLKNSKSDMWNGDAVEMRIDKAGANAATNGNDFTVTADRKKPWSTNNVPDFLFGYVEIAGGFSEAWENVSNKGMTSFSGNPLGITECVVAPAGSDYSEDTLAGITTYEIAIPWAYIYNGKYEVLEWKQYAPGRDTSSRGPRGALGKELGMSMAVLNDGANATAGWDAFMAWGSGVCGVHQEEGARAASGSNSVILVETTVNQTANYKTLDPTPLLDAKFTQENIDPAGVYYDYLSGDFYKDNKLSYEELFALTYDDPADLSLWGAPEYFGKIGNLGDEHGNVLDYTDMTADNVNTYIDTRDGTVEYLFPTSYTFEFDIMYTDLEAMLEGYGSELYNWFGGASGYAYQCGYFFNDNAFKVVNWNDPNEVLSTYYYDLKEDTWYNWKFQYDNESCTARLWIDDLSTEDDNKPSGTSGELGYTCKWGTLVVNSNWRYFYYSAEKALTEGTLLLFRQMNIKTAYDNVKIYNFAEAPETIIYDVPTLPLDTPVEVTTSDDFPESYFWFVPEETGIYSFYSEGDEDTYGYILDESREVINSNDDSNGYNFKVFAQLEAGKKYLLKSHRYSLGAGTYTVQITKSDVASVDFFDLTVTAGVDSYTEYEYNEETGVSDLEWERYSYSVLGAVTMNDGTVEYFDSYYDGDYVNVSDGQSYYSQWTPGNTYSATVSLLGVEKTISIEVVPNPVVSVSVEDVSIVEGTQGGYTTDWDENGDPVEWYFYNYYPTYTVELSDGSTMSAYYGDPVYINGKEYYLSVYDSQSYYEPWGVGEHTVNADFAGFETTFTVEITRSPIAAVYVDDITMIEYTDGYYTTDWDEYGNPTEWYCYWLDVNYTVVLEDNSTVSVPYYENGVTIDGVYYQLQIGSSQSSANQWGVGTHTVYAAIGGKQTTFNVTIKESPIVGVVFRDIELYEGFSGFTADKYNSEIGEYDGTYFRYEYTPSCVVLLEDGTVLYSEDGGVEYCGERYWIEYSDTQEEREWGIGTYSVPVSVLGYQGTVDVTVKESPYTGIEISGTTDLWITLYKNDGTSERVKALGYNGYYVDGTLKTTGETLYISLFGSLTEDGENKYDKDLKITIGDMESNTIDGNLWFDALFRGASYEYVIDVYRMHHGNYVDSEGADLGEFGIFDGTVTKDNIDAITTIAVWMCDEEPWSDQDREFVTVDGVTYYLEDCDFARDCIERVFGITDVDFSVSELYDPERSDKVMVMYQMAGGRGGAICDLRYENGSWIFNGNYDPHITVVMNDDLTVKSFVIDQSDNAPKEIVSVEIATMPHKTSYRLNEIIDLRGLVLRLVYADGTTALVSTGFTTSGFDSKSSGEKTVTVTYREFTTSFAVTVEAGILGDISGDGTINAVDANLLKRVMAGTISMDEEMLLKSADINGDGYVNSVDSNLLKRVIAGTYEIP